MKKAAVLFAIFFIAFTSCKKEVDGYKTVEVVDYISNQPIAGADVVKIEQVYSDPQCLFCWPTETKKSIGVTNMSGLFTSNTEFVELEIKKDGYYIAREGQDCHFEKSKKQVKFHLFRPAMFQIVVNTQTNFFPAPVMQVKPILRDGSPAIINPFGGSTYDGDTSNIHGFGDMVNRISVVRGLSDTLYKIDVFLPANTTKFLTVNY